MAFYRSKPNNSGGGGNPDLSYTVCYTQNGNSVPLKSSIRNSYRLQNKFNSSVIIGNNVCDCSGLFWGCTNFNKPVTIPDGVVDCSRMFVSCFKFNKPVTIPDGVINCYGMFSSSGLNQPIIIPNSVQNCSEMFRMSSARDTITIPKNVIDASFMFEACYLHGQNIYINGTPNVYHMFASRSGSNRVNVFCNSSVDIINTVASSDALTPMSDGNGYYSTYLNIYLYNNYTGT